MSINGTARILRLLSCLLLLLTCQAMAATSQPYLIGRGISDITGPALGMQLWGFSRPDQIGEGIHIRQRSRAFVITQADDPSKRLVFVSADLGSIEHHITLEVVERLQAQLGQVYDLNNVILSATHTHAGVGGYWHSRTEAGLDGGFYAEHFEKIVAGITASIVKAHNDLQPGNILINKGQVEDAGANRSVSAYLQNPQEERQRYTDDTPKEMVLLKFSDDSGDIGVINWYALHPTAMNFYNRFISGDHKGYASLQMEQAHGVRYTRSDDFVAAFAQSDPGDVTPNMNLDNTGPGETDVDTTRILGDRQLEVATTLFEQATEALSGPIDSRRMYIDLSNYEVEDAFTGAGNQHTCPSAYGYSFAGGSTEDGGGHFLFSEGMTEQILWRDWLIRLVTGAPKWTESVRSCQSPKPILFQTGGRNPPLQSQVRSVTVARIGQLVILAVPVEVTTMAGRRLRASVMAELGDWAKHIVLSGYANGYGGYITTPQEYQIQQYEAAHTLHGQWSLPAYQQIASRLASSLQAGTPVANGAIYDDWRGKSVSQLLPIDASEPKDGPLTQALPMAESQYHRGEKVIAEFNSQHPNGHYITGITFLVVEKNSESGWKDLADDGDWQTRVQWREEKGGYIAQLSWNIPANAPTGEYRLRHRGYDAQGTAFTATSENFLVQP
ncbi:MAG: neutral ceramidase [Bacteroidia bacterium]|jgi:neutral ceramidase